LGYRKVVLCGFDFSDPKSFYEDSALYPDLNLEYSGSDQPSSHATLTWLRGHIPVDRVVFAMNDLLLKPAGIELYVENSSSALYPHIPLAPPELFNKID